MQGRRAATASASAPAEELAGGVPVAGQEGFLHRLRQPGPDRPVLARHRQRLDVDGSRRRRILLRVGEQPSASAGSTVRHGIPMASELPKKISENDSPTTAAMPTGAAPAARARATIRSRSCC